MKSAPSTTSLQIKLGGDETTKGGRADKFEGEIVDWYKGVWSDTEDEACKTGDETGDETASMFLVTTATALECEDDSDSEDVWF